MLVTATAPDGSRLSRSAPAIFLRPLRTAEDHALLAAATQAGCPVVQAGDITVQTSGRRLARAPRGFSHLLRTLAPRREVGQLASDPVD